MAFPPETVLHPFQHLGFILWPYVCDLGYKIVSMTVPSLSFDYLLQLPIIIIIIIIITMIIIIIIIDI